jgi:hypothetical protein
MMHLAFLPMGGRSLRFAAIRSRLSRYLKRGKRLPVVWPSRSYDLQIGSQSKTKTLSPARVRCYERIRRS